MRKENHADAATGTATIHHRWEKEGSRRSPHWNAVESSGHATAHSRCCCVEPEEVMPSLFAERGKTTRGGSRPLLPLLIVAEKRGSIPAAVIYRRRRLLASPETGESHRVLCRLLLRREGENGGWRGHGCCNVRLPGVLHGTEKPGWVTVPESSNIQVVEPVASHIVETAHEDMLEEPLRPVMEIEEISFGGCEISRIPVEVEVDELATILATVPVEVQKLAEATFLATVSNIVEVNVVVTTTTSHEQGSPPLARCHPPPEQQKREGRMREEGGSFIAERRPRHCRRSSIAAAWWTSRRKGGTPVAAVLAGNREAKPCRRRATPSHRRHYCRRYAAPSPPGVCRRWRPRLLLLCRASPETEREESEETAAAACRRNEPEESGELTGFIRRCRDLVVVVKTEPRRWRSKTVAADHHCRRSAVDDGESESSTSPELLTADVSLCCCCDSPTSLRR
nr:hypothetical protein Iba_chr13cCG12410 [Ipomoea batatas]